MEGIRYMDVKNVQLIIFGEKIWKTMLRKGNTGSLLGAGIVIKTLYLNLTLHFVIIMLPGMVGKRTLVSML